jgi:hypothetical protein
MHKLKFNRVMWLPEPEDHDYPAAISYLSLLYNERQVKHLIRTLKSAQISWFKAKDIFRASGLSLLGVSNSHVEKNIKKIKKGQHLSPLLLIRRADGERVVIADGYHRMCAVYTLDEDIEVPCKIA